MNYFFTKIISNLFDDVRITPTRFRNFCRFVMTAMKAANPDGKYDTFITKIKAVIDALDQEMNSVKKGLTNQIKSTSEVDTFILSFGQFMKKTAGAIAYALDGDTTAAYFEFYPHKNEDYLTASKTTMPALTLRVFDAATKYATKLGPKLTGDLQAFAAGYESVLDKQESLMTNVGTERTERNAAFVDGQWTMTGIVHDVASLNGRNTAATANLFPFDMLYAKTKPFIVKAAGSLAVNAITPIMNRTVTARVKVWVNNTAVNADVAVWIAMSPGEDMPATAVVVKANSRESIGIERLGSLAGTFIMIKNLSGINEAAYEIEIRGLKKTKEEMAAEKETKKLAAKEQLVS